MYNQKKTEFLSYTGCFQKVSRLIFSWIGTSIHTRSNDRVRQWGLSANGTHARHGSKRKVVDCKWSEWMSLTHVKTGWVTWKMILIFWINLLLMMSHSYTNTILKWNVKMRSCTPPCFVRKDNLPLTHRSPPPKFSLSLTWQFCS